MTLILLANRLDLAKTLLFLGLASLAATPTWAESLTMHVAPGGDDSWSGRFAEPNPADSDGPFASLDRAQRAVREWRTGGGPRGPVTVLIRGVHRLPAPFVLTPEDSGTKDAPVTYAAAPGEQPVLSGGRRITGWRQGPAEIWTAEVPEAKSGRWCFRQLFVNGRRARRARSPNDGYFRVVGLVDPKPDAPWNKGVDRFRFRASDIDAYHDLNHVEVVVFHSWNTSRVRIASVDKAQAIVSFTGPTIFRPLAWDPEQRYYVENARELLDSPGEWYLDRETGVLSYWPLAGEDLRTAEVVAPVLTELVRLDGDPDAGRFVDHVRLVGLSLQHADWTLSEQGYGDPQAAVTVPAVVSAKGARFCALEQCEIAHVGTYGVWFSRGCKENRIVQNHLYDLGAGGVRIGEPAMAASDVAESSNNLISNNYLHDGGCVYAGAVGVWLAQSSHNEISHNEIHSFDYSGISLGWNWGFQPNRTHHNRIEHNHVHHVVRGVLSDAGGIYMLGIQTGTVVRHNIFHDVFPYAGKPAMAWGIYFDSGASGLLVENNLVYHTLTGGLMNTGMTGNVIRNNVFALSGQEAVWRYNWTKEPPSVVERNIFYLTQGELFHEDGGASDFRTRWDDNLYWRADGEPLLFYGEPFQAWQAKGVDQHSLVADPQFVDPARFDFRVKPESPAIQLGFQPIDTSQNGLFGPPEWVALPKQATFPASVLPPPPQPISVDDGFEQTSAGERPALAQVHEENRGDGIRVTDELAAAGKHCLKFTDAAGLEHVFNPHLFYTPGFRQGQAVLSFDVRLEPGAVLGHEWRDSARPYRVGPSLRIDSGKLSVGGKPLTDIPTETWVHVEITCGLGRQASGAWDLVLTLPGQPPQAFRSLACGHPEFNRVAWLGLVSLASAKTVWYVDNLELSLRESPCAR